jgi:hypothetical protein
MMRARNLVLATFAIVGGLAAATSAWSQISGIPREGGFVKPCSLDGVNPAAHPDIFGNPAVALREYGFVRGRDGRWHVIPNCQLK